MNDACVGLGFDILHSPGADVYRQCGVDYDATVQLSTEDTLRHALAVLVGFAVALGLATPAAAGESYLGTIIVQDAGVVSNWFPMDGGAFYIAPQSLITIQPSANAYVCVDALSATRAPTCSATIGVRVDANVAFPTSCQSATGSVLMADGGTVNGCTVAVLPVTGATVNATVWQRRGNEF